MQLKSAIKFLIPSSFSSSQLLHPRFLACCSGFRTDHICSVDQTRNPKIHSKYPYETSDPSFWIFGSPVRPNTTKAQNEEVICVGLDGSPFPEEEKERKNDGERRRNIRDKEEEDDKEYFKHHKASPLSELEIADTRKPMTKATDGTATAGEYGGGGVILWRPEQMDRAEDSLRRAMEMWKENAMRGDPDSPHGKLLRSMRGEYW